MQSDQKITRYLFKFAAALTKIFTPAGKGAQLKKSDYRPDIDGMRAIAVVSVVIFHAFPSLLPGGFIGVDIFYVISGYLISKHIWEELVARKFSIRTFYARRVRRIFPALSVVLLACLAMGWVILTPAEYKQLGRHVFAGSLFLSNILLWKEAGYFDAAADTKPLLHLWSLGIEEQFYIVWPLILAFLWRYTRRLEWLVIGIMGVSLAYSLTIVRHDMVADFYSPLTRFWELALGAVTAYLVAHRPAADSINRTIVSWLGLCLILGAAFFVEKNYLFPGAWALLPTAGAAFLIYSGEGAWLNRQVLSSRLLVWVGLISYPLYLWHWPLLTFARIMESGAPAPGVRFWLVAASVILAWLTYRLLERPVRSRPRSGKIVLALCLSVAFLGITGFTVKSLDGLKSRQFSMMQGDTSTIVLGADRGKLRYECGIDDPQRAMFQYCLSGGSGEAPRYALLGDSKAEALFYGLVRESEPGMQWMMIGTVYPPEQEAVVDERQHRKNLLAFQTIADNRAIKVVALTVALRTIFPLDSETGFIAANGAPSSEKIAAYNRAIQQLEQAGKQVVFVLDNPTFPDPTSCVSGGATASSFLNQFLRRKENIHCSIRYADHLAGTQPYRQFIAELKRLRPGLAVYDPTPLLCDVPRNVCAVSREGKFLYSYGDHISDFSNSMIARDMLPVIRELAP